MFISKVITLPDRRMTEGSQKDHRWVFVPSPWRNWRFVDDEKIEVVVVDDRHINYNGTITSVSSLAQQLKGFNHPVQGTLWFSYKGEKLADLRLRLEKEGCK